MSLQQKLAAALAAALTVLALAGCAGATIETEEPVTSEYPYNGRHW